MGTQLTGAGGLTGGEVRLAVVVPAFDEAAGIGVTLDALAAQTDRDFRLVVVDNVTAARAGLGLDPPPTSFPGAAGW